MKYSFTFAERNAVLDVLTCKNCITVGLLTGLNTVIEDVDMGSKILKQAVKVDYSGLHDLILRKGPKQNKWTAPETARENGLQNNAIVWETHHSSSK